MSCWSAPAGSRSSAPAGDQRARGDLGSSEEGWVAAERGQLREAGNLLFHLSVLVVLVGLRHRQPVRLQGRRHPGRRQRLLQHPDAVRRLRPGVAVRRRQDGAVLLHRPRLQGGLDRQPVRGRAWPAGFQAPLTYRDSCRGNPSTWSASKSYDLRVNHPLTIGGTQIFLIGHGYAPVITVRDAQGHQVYDGPTLFLPESSDFESFGVVKATGRTPGQDIGLEGLFYPTFVRGQRRPRST